jgi:TatD DNase family protein
LDKIVLETDSPYLAPVPHRGKRNESSYLDLVAGKLVDLYKVDFSEIDRITTENAKKMFVQFKIKKPSNLEGFHIISFL